MKGYVNAERVLDAFLAPEHDQLPERVLEAAFSDIARTPQRRAFRAPWRFRTMPVLSRATAIVAVAVVAVVGAGGIMYLNSNDSDGVGSQKTPTASIAGTPVPSPDPTFPGITGWKTYTSPVYGYTMSYPEDWGIGARATQKWQPGESEDSPSVDLFGNDSIAFFTLQFPAPAGADLGSWDGLLAAIAEMCAKPAEFFYNTCPSEDMATRMCLGSPGCHPVAFVHGKDVEPRALFGDPDTGIFTYIQMGRLDNFPAAARYGGTVMLLKSILSQLDVREPGPGETPN